MIRALLALLLVLAAPLAHAQEKMFHVEYYVTSPQLAPDSDERQTRKLWLVGSKYMRFEDVPNAQTGVHGLIIVAEPDIWIIDRKTNKGQHSTDPGPSYAVHFPMLPQEESETVRQLEFGREMEFFEANGARELAREVVDKVNCRVFGTRIDDRELKLYLTPQGIPVQVTVIRESAQYSVRIVRYQPDLEPNLRLFAPPPTASFR